MEEMEPVAESGRELILNLSFRVNEVQAHGQMEAKSNFLFTYIEKEIESLRYAESQEKKL